MTPNPTYYKAIENVMRRRGIDIINQDLREFMLLGGSVDDQIWKEIERERNRICELPITMVEPKPWWKFWQ